MSLRVISVSMLAFATKAVLSAYCKAINDSGIFDEIGSAKIEFATLIIYCRTSTARRKNIGDKGSPCCNPRL